MEICFQTDQKDAAEYATKRHYIKKIFTDRKNIYPLKDRWIITAKNRSRILSCPPDIAPENAPFLKHTSLLRSPFLPHRNPLDIMNTAQESIQRDKAALSAYCLTVPENRCKKNPPPCRVNAMIKPIAIGGRLIPQLGNQ